MVAGVRRRSEIGPIPRRAADHVVAGWLVALLVCLAGSSAAAEEFLTTRTAQAASAPTRRALIVCGLPGDEEHRKLFAATLEKLHKALIEKYGFAKNEVLVRFGAEKQAGDGPAISDARGLSNREGIAADVGELRSACTKRTRSG